MAPSAEKDLARLLDFLIDRAETTEELDHAQSAIDAIRAAVEHRLAVTAAQNPAQRELIIPFGSAGYVALHEIVSPSKVILLAFRHQLEEDYH